MGDLKVADGSASEEEEKVEKVEIKKSAYALLMDNAGDILPSDELDKEVKKPKNEEQEPGWWQRKP